MMQPKKIDRIRQNIRFRLARVYLLISWGVDNASDLMRVLPSHWRSSVFDDLNYLHWHGYIKLVEEKRRDGQQKRKNRTWEANGAVRPKDGQDCPRAA